MFHSKQQQKKCSDFAGINDNLYEKMPQTAQVNSADWWEEYFGTDWRANDGPSRTRHFMERIVESLAPAEKEFLRSRPLRILDWGCAMGDGVDVLAEAFPRASVTGLDFAARAIEEARKAYPQHSFTYTESGGIEGRFDVIITSNCLEHFEFPLEMMETHARSCDDLYIALVPFNEYPLHSSHLSQFREESLPRRIGSFLRLEVRVIDVDSRYWPGKQLLAVYGSERYIRQRGQGAAPLAEREKWDQYYGSLPQHDEDAITRAFNDEFLAAVADFLAPESPVLEAGCGGGWQSLALARRGYKTTLMDFSQEALSYSQRIFEREGVAASFVLQDVLSPGQPEHDLVFNAGVLEHYTFTEQVRFLRGMASRSRNFVLVLVPNRLCYWYWVWRMQTSAAGQWAWGKEVPMQDLSAVFAAAGLRFLGQQCMGQAWTEHFITTTATEEPLRSVLLSIHRSPLVASPQKAYLVAALGAVDPDSPAMVPGWSTAQSAEALETAELAAALADSLALQIKMPPPSLPEIENLRAENAALLEKLSIAETERSASQEALESSLGEMAALQQKLTIVEAESAASRQALEGPHAEVAALQQRLADSESDCARLGGFLARREEDIAQLRTSVKAAHEALELWRQETANLQNRLNQAENMRVQVLEGLRHYSNQFESSISTYRNQRAWQVMLLIRKIYSQLFMEGRRGKLDLMRFALRLPLDGVPPLGAYDLAFPAVMPQMPLALAEPVMQAAAPAQARKAGGPVASARPLPEGYDVIVLPVFEFDFRFQRPQQLAKQFGANGHRVFWVSPSRKPESNREQSYELVPLADNVWEVRLHGSSWNIYNGDLSEDDARQAAAALGDLYDDLNVGASAVLLQLPFWRRLGLALRNRLNAKIVFDCMDDWDAFPDVGPFNRSEQQQLLREADLVVVTSKVLYERHADAGLSPLLVRNGVDFPFFSSVHRQNNLGGYARPVIGYAGAIADWFDFSLLCEAAKLRPQYSFVLIGGLGLEESLVAEIASRFAGIPNIYPIGHKPHEEIPDLLREFDVCMIPFILNRVTEATDPVKMYEYFSLGKPVVATPMPELAQCSELLYVASSAEEFAAKIDAALSEPEDLKERRISFASSNTWLSRYRAIDRAVVKTFDLVSIIIVTHNSAKYLPLCLESVLSRTNYPNFELIVVDGASSDGTPDILRQYAERDDRIRLKFLENNVGFAHANNLGAEMAAGRFLVLLNPDTVVTSHWLGKLLRHYSAEMNLGMVLPVTNYAGNEVRINVSYHDRSSMEEFACTLARTRRGATTALEVGPLFCTLIPRDVWEVVGNLDERFSIGMFEDDDYSLRVRQAGYRIVAAEDCFVHHFGNGSFGQLPTEEYERIFRENLVKFESKWNRTWKAHVYRPGVSDSGTRFSPADFR